MANLRMQNSRIPDLMEHFERYLDAYAQRPAFAKYGKLEYHLETIALRRELGSAKAAVFNDRFVCSLYRTLQAWGIGARASNLIPLEEFSARIKLRAHDFAALEHLAVGGEEIDSSVIGQSLWRIIESLDIVTNDAKLVSGSKALHHILPDLVVPIDRAWTQTFFRWHNPQFQYEQAKCFSYALEVAPEN